MSVSINYPLYVNYSYSQYRTGVLQILPLVPLMSLSGPGQALLTVSHGITSGSNTISNDLGKSASHICAITSK
jgi:hypothetical protein